MPENLKNIDKKQDKKKKLIHILMARFYFIKDSNKTEEEMEKILEESRIIGVINSCERNKIDVETFLTWYKFSSKKKKKIFVNDENGIEDKKKRKKEQKSKLRLKPTSEVKNQKKDKQWWENALDQLPNPEISRKDANELVGQYFLRNGCIREPKGRKGYEVRITVYTLSELKEIRTCIKIINYNLCNAYEKRGYYVQPIYGKDAAYNLNKIRKIKIS